MAEEGALLYAMRTIACSIFLPAAAWNKVPITKTRWSKAAELEMI